MCLCQQVAIPTFCWPVYIAAFYFVSSLEHIAALPSCMLAWTRLVTPLLLFIPYHSSLYADNISPSFRPCGTNSRLFASCQKSSRGGKSRSRPPCSPRGYLRPRRTFSGNRPSGKTKTSARRTVSGGFLWWERVIRIHNLFIAISFDFLVKLSFKGPISGTRKRASSLRVPRETSPQMLFLFLPWFPLSCGQRRFCG